MSHPISITDLLTAIGSDNIKFQYLATCMDGIKGAKGRNLITFGTDALTPSDVALNAGPSGLIIWVEGDLMRQSLSDIKSGNSLTFGKVVEQRDELLSLAERLVQWDIDYPVNCDNGYAGLKALDELIRDNKAAIVKIKGEHSQQPNALLDDVYVKGGAA
ncbi:hypothetical protein ACET93_01825 [Aeromonas veronii]